jgi:hypothetical protein
LHFGRRSALVFVDRELTEATTNVGCVIAMGRQYQILSEVRSSARGLPIDFEGRQQELTVRMLGIIAEETLELGPSLLGFPEASVDARHEVPEIMVLRMILKVRLGVIQRGTKPRALEANAQKPRENFARVVAALPRECEILFGSDAVTTRGGGFALGERPVGAAGGIRRPG